MPSNEDYHEAWENHLKRGEPHMVEDWDATPFLTSLKGKVTLRDYFAAAALTGYRTRVHTDPTQQDQPISREAIVKRCFADADAMLAARGKETP